MFCFNCQYFMYFYMVLFFMFHFLLLSDSTLGDVFCIFNVSSGKYVAEMSSRNITDSMAIYQNPARQEPLTVTLNLFVEDEIHQRRDPCSFKCNLFVRNLQNVDLPCACTVVTWRIKTKTVRSSLDIWKSVSPKNI